VKGFTDSGFKTQVQPLSNFQSDYGLPADEDEVEEDSEDDEDDGVAGSSVSGDDEE
jgi:hypothetical protein